MFRWVLVAFVLLPACSSINDDIVVCGQRFSIDTPVVLWTDPGGYDAYQTRPRFRELKDDEQPRKRYGARRDLPEAIAARVAESGWSLEDLQEVVHLFVVHFDEAGTSRRCFQVLQDMRNLSVHFLLDVDGTIYQTLDLKERAWHATVANNHSIGIEIAHPGAYPQPGHRGMQRWYARDGGGVFMKYPKFLGEPGVRDAEYVPRPARPELLRGVINGREYWQHDFTDAQYEALAHLVAGISRVFPKIDLDYPRRADGAVEPNHIDREALHAHRGVVGHFHVQKNKRDPGPAFDWDRVITRARELR